MYDAELVALLEAGLDQVPPGGPDSPPQVEALRCLLARLPAEVAALPVGDAVTHPVLVERLEFLRARAEREHMSANDLHWRLRELLLSTLVELLGQRAV